MHCFSSLIWLLYPGLLVACTAAASGQMEIEDVTASLTLPTETGALYMRITNGTGADDALVWATVPGCESIELHETTMEGDVIRMRQVPEGRIDIPAGETVALEPGGGLHIMCLGKQGEFAAGDRVPIAFVFDRAGTIEVSAEVVPAGDASLDALEHGAMDHQ